MNEPRTCITTGGNSGIGLATVLELARRGFRSVGTVRSAAKAETVAKAAADAGVQVETRLLDVTDAGACADVVDELQPWALINNAGYSITGSIEDVGDEEARAAIETMVLAPMRLARLSVPHMRAAGSGRIVNISSIYGRATTPLTGWYQGAKHALEGLSDALRMEVARDGVRVILVEPGGFRTGIWEENEREINKREGSRYDSAYRRTLSTTRVWRPLMGDPVQCAKVIASSLTTRIPRTRYLVGYDAQAMALWSSLTPTQVRDRIVPRGDVALASERTATRAGRTRERLRDLHPLRRDWPHDDEPGVGEVAALGDDETEVDRVAADAIRRRGVAPRPLLALGARQRHVHRPAGHIEAARREAVRQRPHSDVRDLAQRRGRRARRAERVGDVLAVRPRLHDARGKRRRDAHVGPVPGHACPRVDGEQGLHHRGARVAEPHEQHIGCEPAVLPCDDLGETIGMREHRVALGTKAIGVERGTRRGGVEVREVADLITDGPAERRRRPIPVGGGQGIQQAFELTRLGREIAGELLDVHGHAGTL